MKPKKDIFDLFREGEPKLAQRPSRDAWKRLENRLDEHKSKNRRSSIRMLSYAAAILVLVVTVSLMTTLLQSDSPGNQDLAFEVKDMVIVNVSDDNNEQVREYQQIQSSRLNNPIAEGEIDKKLVPRMNPDRRDGNLKKFYAKKKRENNDLAANYDQPDNAANIEEIHEPLVNMTAGTEIQPELQPEKETSVSAETAPSPVAFETPVASYQDPTPEEENPTADDNPTVSTLTAAPAAEASEDRAEAFMRGQSMEAYQANKKTKPAGASASPVSIHDFQWLIGRWKHNIKGKNVTEKWIKTDANVLQGKGSAIVDEQIRLIKDMKIKDIDGLIYFLADIDGDGQVDKFRLISNENGKAVFQNASGALPPWLVVLERKQ